MTIKLNSDRLAELGYRGLTTSQYNELNAEFYATIEELVGIRLAYEMSEPQLDEFEKFFDVGDDKGAFEWIEEKFPHYREVVEDVVAELDLMLEKAARETRDPLEIELPSSAKSHMESDALPPPAEAD
jgi:uncharacterized protein DUF5663